MGQGDMSSTDLGVHPRRLTVAGHRVPRRDSQARERRWYRRMGVRADACRRRRQHVIARLKPLHENATSDTPARPCAAPIASSNASPRDGAPIIVVWKMTGGSAGTRSSSVARCSLARPTGGGAPSGTTITVRSAGPRSRRPTQLATSKARCTRATVRPARQRIPGTTTTGSVRRASMTSASTSNGPSARMLGNDDSQ